MSQRHQSENHINRLHWLSRLISLFRPPEETRDDIEFAAVVETIFEEEPMPEQFCQHSRWQRLAARFRHRVFGTEVVSRPGQAVCPLCGLLPVEQAPVESVLRVWFHDGEIYEWTFVAEHPEDCYRISDSAVHIHLKDSVLSYSLEIVAAVHFQRRRVPPEAPEVVAAERIIAGKPTEQ